MSQDTGHGETVLKETQNSRVWTKARVLPASRRSARRPKTLRVNSLVFCFCQAGHDYILTHSIQRTRTTSPTEKSVARATDAYQVAPFSCSSNGQLSRSSQQAVLLCGSDHDRPDDQYMAKSPFHFKEGDDSSTQAPSADSAEACLHRGPRAGPFKEKTSIIRCSRSPIRLQGSFNVKQRNVEREKSPAAVRACHHKVCWATNSPRLRQQQDWCSCARHTTMLQRSGTAQSYHDAASFDATSGLSEGHLNCTKGLLFGRTGCHEA